MLGSWGEIGPDWDNSNHPSLWATLCSRAHGNLGHREPGSRSLPGTSVQGECPLILSVIPFGLEAVGEWREEVESGGSRWKPHLAQMTLHGPAPSQAPLPRRASLLFARPLGLKQAESIGTIISDYMLTLGSGEWNVLINVRLFCCFQSFGFQPSFKTALCTTDELLKTLLKCYCFSFSLKSEGNLKLTSVNKLQ